MSSITMCTQTYADSGIRLTGRGEDGVLTTRAGILTTNRGQFPESSRCRSSSPIGIALTFNAAWRAATRSGANRRNPTRVDARCCLTSSTDTVGSRRPRRQQMPLEIKKKHGVVASFRSVDPDATDDFDVSVLTPRSDAVDKAGAVMTRYDVFEQSQRNARGRSDHAESV